MMEDPNPGLPAWLLVQERLGLVPQGALYKAVDRRLNSDGLVAIKCLKRGREGQEHKYVRREVLTHRKLFHKHIVQLREVFLTPTHLCLLFDYGGDMTLHAFVQSKGPVPEEMARWFFQQMVLVVDYVHSLGLAHRDINLTNFVVTNDLLVKMTSFGFCKDLERDSECLTNLGTDSYKAPEVWSGRGYGKAADIWACGVCLYNMLFGVCFTLQDMVPHAGGGVRFPTGDGGTPLASREAEDLLSSMLVANPEERTTMEQIWDHPWFAFALADETKTYNAKMLSPEMRHQILSHIQSETDVKQILEASTSIAIS